MGCKEPPERGATGVLKAVSAACSDTIRLSLPCHKDKDDEIGNTGNVENELELPVIFKSISSIVTDGTSLNSGERNGLWKLIDDAIEKGVTHDDHIPLLKIWCAVHRSQLAWKSVTSSIAEVNRLIMDLTGIATYFRVSAVRRRELEQKALAEKLHCKRYPKYFEVRFCEFIFNLIDAHLTSWNAVVLFLQGRQEREAQGYLNWITSKAHLELAAFLCDVLLVFKY